MYTINSKANEVFGNLVFTENETKLIESVLHRVTLNKGDILVKPGDMVEANYYISEGCLRTYYLHNDGKEHTLQFGIKGWWISDYTALYTGTKAIMTIEALERSTIYKISRTDQGRLCQEIPNLDQYYNAKLEGAFVEFQKRILAIISQSAKQRYLRFLNLYPKIEKHVKNYHIASYLGITTESLSRIRKDLSEN